jgi:hypothetical protein
MYVIHRESQTKMKAEIVNVSKEELVVLLKIGRFEFDWIKEAHFDIYAIRLVENENVIGLMAIKDVADELRTELVLLESSKENIGQNKKFEHIAGCLIAWACRLAFIKGYYGFISLIPKTRLISHYKHAYGFEQFGRHLASETRNSHRLIQKFLENGE